MEGPWEEESRGELGREAGTRRVQWRMGNRGDDNRKDQGRGNGDQAQESKFIWREEEEEMQPKPEIEVEIAPKVQSQTVGDSKWEAIPEPEAGKGAA